MTKQETGFSPEETSLSVPEKDNHQYYNGSYSYNHIADMERLLNTAGNSDVFLARIKSVIARLGFSDYCFYTLDPYHLAFSSLPDSFYQAYDKQNYQKDDLILDYGRHNRAPAFYSDLIEDLSEAKYNSAFQVRNREIRLFYRSHGIQDMYLIPIRAEDRYMMLVIMDLFSERGLIEAGRPKFTNHYGEQLIQNYKGHFYLTCQVNDQEIAFLLDTGASDCVLTGEDAYRLRIDLENLNYDCEVHTANGQIKVAACHLDRIKVDQLELKKFKVYVNRYDMPRSVLGQSFLRIFRSYEVTGDQMILKR